MKKSPEPGSAADWLRHARADLQLARLALRQEGVLPEQVCFHAQQAAEKALKAVLVARGIEFPFVHDLDELAQLACGGGGNLPETLNDLDALTPYAVATRYPGAEEGPSDGEAEAAIALAAETVGWAARACGA